MNTNDLSADDAERIVKSMEESPNSFLEVFLEMDLSNKQNFFLDATKTHKHIVAIWSRQTGKSTVMAAYILWRVLYGKGLDIHGQWMPEHIAIVAPIKDQIKNIYEKLQTLINKSDFINGFITKINTEIIKCKNGNEAKFFSASPGSQIRGYTATCIVIDESQDITDTKYNGDVLPFGATTNALVIEAGTPKTKNHFYHSIQNKKILTIKQPWFECPFLSKEYVMSQKELSPTALWRQEYLCFHPDTYIMSERPKKISDFKIGDTVYNNEGNLVKVNGILKRNVSEWVLKITVWNGNSFICTKDHPIYSSIRKGIKRHTMKVLTFNKAEKLKVNDFIHFPKLKSKKERIYTTEELRLFGLWVAEGSVSAKERTLVFSMGSHEKELIQEIINSVKKIYNKKCKLQIKNLSGSSTQILINSVDLVKKYKELFGKGAKNKRVPDFIFHLSKKEIADFISGYYDGDGNDNDKKMSCSSISKQLIEDINTLLLKFNIYSKISCMRDRECLKNIMGRTVKVRPKWQLQTGGKSYLRFKEMLGESGKSQKTSKFIECEDYDLLQIKEIEKIYYTGEVYNLETGDNHTYLTEIGSVHNCEFMEEGVLAFPSILFEPETKNGMETGRWNLGDYDYISTIEEFTKEKAIKINELVKNGATFVAGLDLGKQNDNTVYSIYRTDQRPIRLYAQIIFELSTAYSVIAKQIAMFHRIFQPYEFNFDYSNEKGFKERLIENDIPVVDKSEHVQGAIPFTSRNKTEMVSTTRILLENYALQLPKKADTLLSQFLNQQFEKSETGVIKYFHPTNEHDDSLWSSLLALKNITISSAEDIISFKNPWEKFDEEVHGPTKKETYTRDVLVANRERRDRGRRMYTNADFKRNGRSLRL